MNTEDENRFDILVATDIHLGYAEKDPERGEDSFIAFEEILATAKERKVDMILLGGDLFHENKPSQRCLYRCISLLRRYCMGDKPVPFQFMSDQSVNFGHCPFPNVNYEDPNLNISMPVFSIHGNHDDPSVNWQLSAMHLLSATGLINYFGWCGNLQQINISPLLLRKGSTYLGLYGLGSVKDERLSRLMERGKVTVLCPPPKGQWFNIMILHQNHVIRGTSPNSFIPETLLSEEMDLVIWGHEHECIPLPQNNPSKEFFVLQPGSSVATSLSEGESAKKHIFLVQVQGVEVRISPIPLKTVRPFVFDTVCLSDYGSLQPNENKMPTFGRGAKNKEVPLSKKVEEFVKEKIDGMLADAISMRTGHEKQPTKPLIRLRLEYNHPSQMINPVRIGNFYSEDAANPNDMILQKKEVIRGGKKIKGEKEKLDEDALVQAAELAREHQDQLGEIRVETVVEQYFERGGQMLNEKGEKKGRELEVLSIKGLLESVTRSVDKQESDAVTELFKYQINRTLDHLKAENVPGDENAVNEELDNFRLKRQMEREKEEKELASYLDNHTKPKAAGRGRGAASGNGTTKRGAGTGQTRGRGRGARSRGAGRPRAAEDDDEDEMIVDDDDDDNEIMDVTPVRGRGGRGRARGRGRAGASAGSSKADSMSQLSITNSFVSRPRPKHTYISDSDDD